MVRRWGLVAAVALAFGAACSTAVGAGADGGAEASADATVAVDADAADDTAGDAGVAPGTCTSCPTEAPTVGSPCSTLDLDCEYPDDAGCRVQFWCDGTTFKAFASPYDPCPAVLPTCTPADASACGACQQDGALCACAADGGYACGACPAAAPMLGSPCDGGGECWYPGRYPELCGRCAWAIVLPP